MLMPRFLLFLLLLCSGIAAFVWAVQARRLHILDAYVPAQCIVTAQTYRAEDDGRFTLSLDMVMDFHTSVTFHLMPVINGTIEQMKDAARSTPVGSSMMCFYNRCTLASAMGCTAAQLASDHVRMTLDPNPDESIVPLL
jgi:hypothetical protein